MISAADTLEPMTTLAPSSVMGLREHYQRVRLQTQAICEPLSPEDCALQSMPDASPVRWHLAHTTWFFETFVLKNAVPSYKPYNPAYEYLFNSYYNQVGKQFPRARRGVLSRPGLAEIFEYRQAVDARMSELLEDSDTLPRELLDVATLGLHHEQQHQELILTDIKHLLSCNPMWPVYRERTPEVAATPASMDWIEGREGIHAIGYVGEAFAYDNETPRHEVLLQPHELAWRLVTNAEFLEFVEDGGYQRPEFWLSLGWNTVQAEQWNAPLYWLKQDGIWNQFTLAGMAPLEPHEPVCHVSFFEADAYARWRGARLPTEAEWELAAIETETAGNFVESGQFHPVPANPAARGMQQMFGDVWEWTASPYTPYPGYQPAPGAIGEYNGKFMCNQYVLRGGSCATSESHIRPTYRNFFPPDARWQFSGIRLAR
ncbi:ergothioneine biosynthesis protein EgtB [Aeoliella sp. SH292]|uniref:ergothioneine biosynthesis protein EgtB n=1 Tax=Aeoliella sp. SH292 TaxID=3454464 RepID=UPI003F9C74F1